jgi:2-(1,2-epoxy-1,2-dihydrophenyl)acetyl-CoA isomerase
VESEIVRVEKSDHVLTIQIDRPGKRNAISPDEFREIGRACVEAERDDDVRVVVLAGNDEGFCAGADHSSTDISASGGQMPPLRSSENTYLPLLELSKPLIGAITGIAAGGGLGLALCCDIRIASERASFATSFARIGIPANDTVAWLLPRIVGIAKALELIYDPLPIDAAEAERIDLVSYVVPHDSLLPRVAELAARIAAGPPVAMRLSKVMVMDGLSRSYRDHIIAQEYSALANRALANHDIEEGVTAFKERRRPEFRGIIAECRWQGY